MIKIISILLLWLTWHPGKSKSGGDRLPPKCCSEKWLRQEIDIVDKQIYIIIGSYAAKKYFLIKTLLI